MNTKKENEINNTMLDMISAGISSTSIQGDSRIIENERAEIMKDLLFGLSFGPVAPECTDARR